MTGSYVDWCMSPLSHPPVSSQTRDCPRGLPRPTCLPYGKTAPIGTRHSLSDLRAVDSIALSPMSLSIYDGPVLFFDPPAPCFIIPSPPICLMLARAGRSSTSTWTRSTPLWRSRDNRPEQHVPSRSAGRASGASLPQPATRPAASACARPCRPVIPSLPPLPGARVGLEPRFDVTRAISRGVQARPC